MNKPNMMLSDAPAQQARMTSAVLPCNCLTGHDPDCQAHHPQPSRTCGDEKPKGAV
jgi:hypothetical protein